MAIKESPEYLRLVEALAVLKDLAIPESLQKTALEHLLGQAVSAIPAHGAISAPLLNAPLTMVTPLPITTPLRSFVGALKLKGAVSEIPCLAYWAKTNEQLELLNEKMVIELYRRAGLRPPKNVNQSLRDLCSKKYGRLESAENGQVKLSRVGEDFVLHDVIGKNGS